MTVPSDSDSYDDTIVAGGSTTLSVRTVDADSVVLLIDDGTKDGFPSSYDLTQRVLSVEHNEYQFYDEVTEETARSWEDPAVPTDMEYEITNVSGGDATFRISVISYQSGDF